jgi:hypothetical protein
MSPTRYVKSGGSFVSLGGGGTSAVASDQHPGALLSVGLTGSTRPTISFTTGAVAHTAGLYAEVSASLPADCSGVMFVPTAATALNATVSSTLLEIGIGAALSETVWATGSIGYMTSAVFGFPFVFPGALAAGTRVAVRARSARTSLALNGVFIFLPEKTIPLTTPVTMGVNTATSRGVTLTAPVSLDTKSAWTEIEDSTPSAFSALSIFTQSVTSTTMNSSGVLVDIGIGAAGSETVLIPDFYLFASSTAEYYSAYTPRAYGIDIPAGSRLSARYSRANNNNAVDLILIGA